MVLQFSIDSLATTTSFCFLSTKSQFMFERVMDITLWQKKVSGAEVLLDPCWSTRFRYSSKRELKSDKSIGSSECENWL